MSGGWVSKDLVSVIVEEAAAVWNHNMAPAESIGELGCDNQLESRDETYTHAWMCVCVQDGRGGGGRPLKKGCLK